MNITIVLPFVNLTGGVRVLLDYANWLHDHGHAATVVYPLWPYRFSFTRRDQIAEFRKAIRIQPAVTWLELRCRLLRVPYVSNRFLPQADVVVASSWPVARSVAALDSTRGRKVYAIFHHESGTGPEEQIRQTYDLPFYRVCFSERVRNTIEARFGRPIHAVVAASVDQNKFYQDATARDGGVLMLYHNDPRKGAGDGLEALTLIRSRFPRTDIRLCGTVRPRGLETSFPFLFHPGDNELRHLYSRSVAFLYPSRHEGFGLPPLEAMACGCPVVTTDVGAICEFTTDGRNALVVRPGDVDGMAHAVGRLLRDTELRNELSRCGLETARQFTLGHNGPRFAEALLRAWRDPWSD